MMRTVTRTVSRNPIVRRVRRHAAIATLLRPMEPASVQRAVGQQTTLGAVGPARQPSTASVKATLLPGSSSLPMGYVCGEAPVPDVASASPAPAVQRLPTPVPQGGAVGASPAEDSEIRLPPIIQPEAESSAISDADWQRLKTISERHQRKRAEEVPPGAESISVPAQPRVLQSTHAGSAHQEMPSIQPKRQEEPEAVSQSPKPGEQRWTEAAVQAPAPGAASEVTSGPSLPIQRSADDSAARRPATAPESPASAVSAERDAGPDSVEGGGLGQHRPAEHSEGTEPTAGAETSIVRPSTSVAVGEATESMPAQHPVDRLTDRPSVQLRPETGEPPRSQSDLDPSSMDRLSPSLEETPGHEAWREPVLEPSLPDELGVASIAPDGEAESGTMVSGIQAQPLQAVWPVQRLEEPASSPTPVPPAPPASAFVPGFEQEPLPVSGEETGITGETQRVLADVVSGQPTTSSIEVITPRRPRPAAPPQQRRWADERLPEPIGESESTAPQVAMQPLVPPREAILQASNVQMQRDEGLDADSLQAAQEATEPTLVQTEIGPLPADLWHLLGESPPGQSPSGTSPPEATPQTAGEAAVMGAVSAAEAGPSLAAPPSTWEMPAVREIVPPIARREVTPRAATGMDGLVQRLLEGEEGGTETETTESPTEEGTEAETTGEAPAESLNTDELACRVYAEIRRRLSLESERTHRRL